LKGLAAFKGNKALVAAIDEELSLSSADGLTARIENTTWVWNGSETITFLAGQRGKWSYDNKNSFTWRVSQNDKNLIEGKGPRNQTYTIVLNPDTKTGVVREEGQGDRATHQLGPK
jgi:hypothetical protein